MAVAHDASTRFPAGAGTTDTTTGDRTFTHTPSGTPKGVVVAICVTGTTAPVTGVLYGGVAMTQRASPTDTAEPGRVELWTLTDTAIATGAQTVTLQGCIAAPKFATCSTVTAATSQTTFDAVGTKSTTTATNPTVNITTSLDAMIYGAIHGGSTTPGNYVPTANYTTQDDVDYGALSAKTARSNSAIAAGTFAFDFTYATSDDYCIACVAIAELAAGPTTYFGESSASMVFTATTAARKTTFGASTGTMVFAGTTAATRKTFSTSTATVTFTATTAARRKALGASSGTLTFTATTAQRIKAVAASSGRITFTATTNGVIAGGGAVTHFGASSATVVFTATTAQRVKAMAASQGRITFTGTTAPRLIARTSSSGQIVFTATTNGSLVGAISAGDVSVSDAASPSVVITNGSAPDVAVADGSGSHVTIADRPL